MTCKGKQGSVHPSICIPFHRDRGQGLSPLQLRDCQVCLADLGCNKQVRLCNTFCSLPATLCALAQKESQAGVYTPAAEEAEEEDCQQPRSADVRAATGCPTCGSQALRTASGALGLSWPPVGVEARAGNTCPVGAAALAAWRPGGILALPRPAHGIGELSLAAPRRG